MRLDYEVEQELVRRMEKTGRSKASFINQALTELFDLARPILVGEMQAAREYIGLDPL